MNILLDLDGVLANFHLGFLKHHGMESEYTKWRPGHYDLPSLLGITEPHFWTCVPPGMFENLPPMADMEAIIQIVTKYDPNFHICTSPGPHAYAAQEKIVWMRKYLGMSFKRYVITSNKTLLANRWNVLIDDWETQVQLFKETGGMSILVPRPWNGRHGAEESAPTIIDFELAHLEQHIHSDIVPPPSRTANIRN